jgi:ADP-heptose:LPS heptosyltransferase
VTNYKINFFFYFYKKYNKKSKVGRIGMLGYEKKKNNYNLVIVLSDVFKILLISFKSLLYYRKHEKINY